MRAIVNVKMDNDAFVDRAGAELAELLREIADRVEDEPAFEPGYEYAVHDSNGNTVGRFEIRAIWQDEAAATGMRVQ